MLRASNTLLAFTPRQVLLASGSAMSLDSEHKALLLRSVARFLNANGFPKTLKKFLSEAQIQMDAISSGLVDLDELYIKYLENCDDSKNKTKKKTEEITNDKHVEEKTATACEIPKEKSKNKEGKKASKAPTKASPESEAADSIQVDTSNIPAEEKSTKKSKSKKKKKDGLESTNITSNTGDETQVSDDQKDCKKASPESEAADSIQVDISNKPAEEKSTKKSKSKKKKKDGLESTNLTSNTGDETQVSDDQKDSKKRKRKRNVSDENDSKTVDTKVVEESKRRKIEDVKLNEESQKMNEVQNNSGEVENGGVDKSAEKSSVQKSKKQQKGSAEPKTAFQRVKVDEVVFTDERLKDNSYWAKSGAESGYGAKAQEVLEQVRGRGFRHEKTKKKRGSYRGGQIDLASHSVKYFYSDED